MNLRSVNTHKMYSRFTECSYLVIVFLTFWDKVVHHLT